VEFNKRASFSWIPEMGKNDKKCKKSFGALPAMLSRVLNSYFCGMVSDRKQKEEQRKGKRAGG
jgi:hypothetical protein